MKDYYIFPAVFDFADDGISIEFPDLPGCLPCAQTQDEALKNAKEALGLHLYGMEQDGDDIPEASRLQDIHLEKNQTLVLVEAWMPLVRDRMNNRSVSRTVTIPAWLNTAAVGAGVNFSQTLQEALKAKLAI